MQELASVVFSLLNLAAHAHNLHRIRRELWAQRTKATKAHYPYGNLWIANALFSINAWICSAMFHSRDTRVTERLDYFSADALVMWSTLSSLIRVFAITSPLRIAAVLALGLVALLRHYYYMQFVSFDYSYNQQVGIAW
jgi:hypothetical protein